ncbi:hypothetical protein OG285_24925 [Streptomyces sp. NBC_01471]|uniref:hypothetical protein n=1 Tax=Streptomyces sp. NBC_01471 TaxID=2903879 RepID=UPI00325091D2
MPQRLGPLAADASGPLDQGMFGGEDIQKPEPGGWPSGVAREQRIRGVCEVPQQFTGGRAAEPQARDMSGQSIAVRPGQGSP